MDKMTKWAGIASGTIGVIALIAAVYFYQQTTSFLDSTLQAKGHISKLIQNPDQSKGGVAPEFTFKDGNDKSHTVSSADYGTSGNYKIDEEVLVVFEKEKPHEAKIYQFIELWILPLMCGVVGGVNILMALILAVALPMLLRNAEAK